MPLNSHLRWSWPMEFLQDFRGALRMLGKNRGFTAVAVLSLALGIGAGTSVFSLVNAILLRSLPLPQAQELRVLKWSGVASRVPSFSGDLRPDGNRHIGDAFSLPMLHSLQEQAAPLADVFGYSPLQDVVVRTRDETLTAAGLLVSEQFFSGLRARPQLGRLLDPAEDFVGSATRVVISHSWWERHFALDPHVVGQTLAFNGSSFTVVGVLPRGFTSPLKGQTHEFYVPLVPESPLFLLRPARGDFHWHIRLMARLRPGATDAQLRASSDVVFARVASVVMGDPMMRVEPGHAGLTHDRSTFHRPLLLMLGAVGLVMLVACANLAGLALAQGTARQHELAVRAALGASRGRLIRQSLTESLVLTLLGGGLGVLLSLWGIGAISRLLAGSAEGLRYDFSLDLTVMAFSLGLALLTALLSGLLPALRAGRVDPVAGFKSRGALGAPRLRVGRMLVAAQIGLSLLLLAGAGLYLRSLVNLARIDAGFNTDHLVLVQTPIRAGSYANDQPAQFYARVQEALAALPGVRGATLLEFPLLSQTNSSGGVRFVGHPPTQDTLPVTRRLSVGETFFDTLGIPLLQGRGLRASDGEGGPKVVVVNEAFARVILGQENPLGLRLTMYDAEWEIVGVCRDAKYSDLKEVVRPTTYFPFRQRFYSRFKATHLRGAHFALRTDLPLQSLAPALREAVAKIDPEVPVGVLTTQAALRDQNIGQERLLAGLCAALAGLALLLSCIGLYGLMAYQVARRTGEIAVRMALGATRSQVALPIVREALLLAVLGVAAGIPAALALVRFIRSQLYGVDPADPTTLMGTAALLVLVTILSAWIPARRAARVDPMQALRSE